MVLLCPSLDAQLKVGALTRCASSSLDSWLRCQCRHRRHPRKIVCLLSHFLWSQRTGREPRPAPLKYQLWTQVCGDGAQQACESEHTSSLRDCWTSKRHDHRFGLSTLRTLSTLHMNVPSHVPDDRGSSGSVMVSRLIYWSRAVCSSTSVTGHRCTHCSHQRSKLLYKKVPSCGVRARVRVHQLLCC